MRKRRRFRPEETMMIMEGDEDAYFTMSYNCSDLFDVVCVLFHGDFLHSALKAKEMLDVQTGILLETRPAWVLWVNL